MNEWMNESVYSLKFTTFINENSVCHNFKCMVSILLRQYMLSNVNDKDNACSRYFEFPCSAEKIRL